MIDEPLVRDLLRPGSLPGRAGRPKFVATHASYVFLAGRDVYKIKRPKDYGFFDYSTLEKRKFFCGEEIRLNRRAAPGVYLGLRPVRLDRLGHSLTRGGRIVDYAVHMRRLPDSASALERVRAGRLSTKDLDLVARWIAEFYSRARAVRRGGERVREIIRENFRQVEPYAGRWMSRRLFRETRSAQERWLKENRPLLRRRTARDGHGDLRLEHVYLLPDGPAMIDCIEFSDRFRVIDPALDVAFFAMELYRHGREDLAEYFLGRFAFEADDYDLYPLIDGYLSYRAWVRGKVALFLAADPQVDRETSRAKAREGTEFFELSRRFLRRRRRRPTVVPVCGLIGSGKSTLAWELSRRRSIPVVSGDATRKFLAGLAHETRGGDRIYTPAFSRRVHREILRRAALALRARRSVILDSTFRSRELRRRARRMASSAGARFLLIECRVPEAVARRRLARRAGGVSDARAELFDRIKGTFEPVTELPASQHLVVDGRKAAGTDLQPF
jgi:aminoglycoside phosphotransferase family enzyme/predicted kinase